MWVPVGDSRRSNDGVETAAETPPITGSAVTSRIAQIQHDVKLPVRCATLVTLLAGPGSESPWIIMLRRVSRGVRRPGRSPRSTIRLGCELISLFDPSDAWRKFSGLVLHRFSRISACP